MLVVAIVCLALALLIAMGNIVGVLLATKEHGFSTVPVLSLLFCATACIISSDRLGLWALLPTIIDPGTWVLLILPAHLLYRLLFVSKRDG